MIYSLLKLQLRKTLRSVSLSRELLRTVLVAIFGFFFFLMLLSVGIGLPAILKQITARFNVVPVLNTVILFFFLLEVMYRFFLQKMATIELQHYLHLPIGRPLIITFLLLRSFITPYNLIPLILFGPFAVMEVARIYTAGSALGWLLNIVLISGSVHWLVIWYRQKYQNSLASFLVLLGICATITGAFYYEWLNIRSWVEPVFTMPLTHPSTLFFSLVLFVASFSLTYRFYYRNAYWDTFGSQDKWKNVAQNISLFDRFGAAGAFADQELKLILRHKKSRGYLFLSLIFLGYGILFYTDEYGSYSEGIPSMGLTIGILLTGLYIVQYGQLYLSWNSPYFDFFIKEPHALQQLMLGKYLLLITLSLVAFILTIPYIYFGIEIVLVHAACFIFNIGINIHVIVWLALWKPKPMDLNRSSMFNYEGAGLAQFLMAIPVIGLPYLIYSPVRHYLGTYAGLAILAGVGVMGMLLHKRLIAQQVRYVTKKKYEISASFRQEI